MKFTRIMREDWEQRALTNPLYYIKTDRANWDVESFFKSGEQDFEKYLEPLLYRIDGTTGLVALDVGCGVGRITLQLAKRFERVCAVDVTHAMLQQGSSLVEERNILWVMASGNDLAMIRHNSVDLVFSYLVLQHLPAHEIARTYIEEFLRVLRPGGTFCFQFNSSRDPSMNWRGRAAWRVLDTLHSAGLGPSLRALARLMRLDFLTAGSTWRGVSLDPVDVVELVCASGGCIRRLVDAGTPQTWCIGFKSED